MVMSPSGRRRSLRQELVGRGERVILGALMSLAATIVERQLRKVFGSKPPRASGAP